MNRQPGHNVSPQPLAGGGGPLPVLLKGIILALLISLVLLFAAALLLYFTNVPEKIAPYVVFGISLTAILVGSSYGGRKIGSRGWINGGIVGVIYVSLMLVIGLFFLEDATLGWNLISKLFLGFIFGAAGGMWGVNR